MKTSRMLVLVSALMGLGMVSQAADAGLLALVPADPGLIAGVSVDRARSSEFGQRVITQMQNDSGGLLKLIETTGFDPRKDLHDILVVTDGKQTDRSLVLARGAYDTSKIQALLRTQGAKEVIYKGVIVFSPPKSEKALAFALTDNSLAIMGDDAMVKAAIDRRAFSSYALSKALLDRISKWSAYDAWFLSTEPFKSLGVNSNGKNQVMPAGLAVESIQSASGGVRFTKDIAVAGEALTRSPQDAQALADVVRLMVAMIKMNAGKNADAEKALKLLDTMQLAVSGASATFSLTIPEEFLNEVMPKRAGAQVAARQR